MLINSQPLYQLSYPGIERKIKFFFENRTKVFNVIYQRIQSGK